MSRPGCCAAVSRREQLVRARSRAKNEIHAVLMRRLKGKPPFADLFGVKARQWLAGLELPVEEQETVAACLRHVEFLEQEIAAVDALIAEQALESEEVRRLRTVPGVNVICAQTFLAAVGDIRRFPTARKLVGYLGLDPRVRQSGARRRPGAGGSQSRARPRRAGRWSRPPGRSSGSPARCTRSTSASAPAAATRSPSCACARKLAVLFWCLLSRSEDYAHQQPSLTAKKLRLLEIRAGAKPLKGTNTGLFATRERMRKAEAL
jgi:transposase